MRATDFYKLLYQGVFGVGHIIGEGAGRRLEEEAASLDLEEHPEEPLLEKIPPDGSMFRVNLRPYLRQTLPLEELYSAMIETAKEKGDPIEFAEVWDIFNGLVASGVIEVNLEELETLNAELRQYGPRPHHHSREYREAYYPAYRIIGRGELERILGLEPD